MWLRFHFSGQLFPTHYLDIYHILKTVLSNTAIHLPEKGMFYSFSKKRSVYLPCTSSPNTHPASFLYWDIPLI